MDKNLFPAQRREDEEALAARRQNYADIANQRLSNVASGDNWNPWLAIQQGAAAIPLWMAERRVQPPTSGFDSPLTNQREATWDKLLQEAEASGKSGQPMKNRFPGY